MNSFQEESIANNIESFIIEEKVPSEKINNNVFWKLGEFYLKDQKRTATITDVKFISENTLVAAHRAAAKLYLIEYNNNKFTIIDTLLLDTAKESWDPIKRYSNRRFFHPDLITLQGNTIYISEYTNRCCIVDIVKNKLVYKKVVNLGRKVSFHGCYSDGNDIMFGCVKTGNITVYNEKPKTIKTLRTETGIGKRIKTIGKEDNYIILGVDQQSGPSIKNPGAIINTWINLYDNQNEKPILLDSLAIPITQIDGHKFYQGSHFFTMHDGTDKTGYICIIKINNQKLNLIKKIPCNHFPHGIDALNDKLIYSSYATSSIIMHDLQELLKD